MVFCESIMPFVHPNIRLLSALGFVLAIIAASNLFSLAAVYALVFMSVLATGSFRQHARFVFFVTIPILLALVVVWGFIMPSDQIPKGYLGGLSYATFTWLRIVAFGGVLQALMLPLVNHPLNLKAFLERNGLSGSFGTLILASVIFLPEVQRRLSIIIDARRSQGYTVSGFSGLQQLSQMLMPLVASLLDSASKRAEHWSHRGIFIKQPHLQTSMVWNQWQTLIAILTVTIAIACGIWL